MSSSDDGASHPAKSLSTRRFQKGQSGNPKGRPKSEPKQASSAYDVILDRTLTITEGGKVREATLEEALQFKTYQQALGGNRMAQYGLDPKDEPRLLLEPWAVQKAINRGKSKRLDEKGRAEVARCTKDPSSLTWPTRDPDHER